MARERKFLMGQPPRTEHLQRVDAKGRGLFVRCDWAVDRYQHQIGWVIDGIEHAALESREGTPDDQWPPSPPLQQLSMQMIEGNPALLGVGMAGSSHWSASFVLLQQKIVELVVELACLVPKNAGAETRTHPVLRSTYKLKEPFQVPKTAAETHDFSGESDIPAAGRQVDATIGLERFPMARNRPSILLQQPGLTDLVASARGPESTLQDVMAIGERLLIFGPASVSTTGATQWSFRIGVAN